MSFFNNSEDIAERVTASIRKAMDGVTTSIELQEKIAKLRGDIETLKIEKARIVEGQERAQREVEHKVGLERKRQEFEVEAAKREAIVSVREENLKEDKRRFEEAMTMQNERLDDMKTLLAEMMKRLPSASIEITETRGRSRKAS